jgi:hypothetical protein
MMGRSRSMHTSVFMHPISRVNHPHFASFFLHQVPSILHFFLHRGNMHKGNGY